MKNINFNFKKNDEFSGGDLSFIWYCLVGIRYLLSEMKKKLNGRILANTKVISTLDNEINSYTNLIESLKIV